MNNLFMETAVTLNNSFVKEWKDKGNRVVGFTCSFVPVEILHAAGILPYRIRGFGATEATIGDTYFGPFICSLPKSMLQLAGEGRFDFLDGAIITPGCDAMRRLDECWRKAGEDIAGIVPGFFFHFGVPHKYTSFTIEWFKDEIRRLMHDIEKHFGVTLSDEKLRGSIDLFNKSRTLLDELDKLRTADKPLLTGAQALAVMLSGSSMPREEYIAVLEQYLQDLKKNAKDITGKIRLMVVGSASDDVELMSLIEGDQALVVADNLCFGSRFHQGIIASDIDPVQALAERYLSKNDCPRMFGQYEARLKRISEQVTKARVDGVILQNIRFCDLHGAENGLMERDLESRGIPCLKIEREYGPMVEKGRLKMRVDAFLERISQRRHSA